MSSEVCLTVKHILPDCLAHKNCRSKLNFIHKLDTSLEPSLKENIKILKSFHNESDLCRKLFIKFLYRYILKTWNSETIYQFL